MKREHILPLAALALLSFALGSYRLGELSLSLDEGFSAYVARMSLRDELSYLTAWDAHPPLHYFVLHLWTQVAGSSEFALRLPGVALGILLVPLLYHTGRLIAGDAAGLFAALLGASDALLIYYARQARMYGIATVFALLAVYFALRTMRESRRTSDWVGLLGAVVLCLYTLYYTVFPLAFVAMILLAETIRSGRRARAGRHGGRPLRKGDALRSARLGPGTTASACATSSGSGPAPAAAGRHGGRPLRKGGALAAYLGVALLAVALYAPWLPNAMAQAASTAPGAWRSFVPPLAMLASAWQSLALGPTQDARQPLAQLAIWLFGVVALAPLLEAGVLRYRNHEAGHLAAIRGLASELCAGARTGLQPWLIAAGFLLLPLALIALASYRQPIYHERYITVLVPAFALLVGIGLAVLRRVGAWAIALGLMIVLGTQASALLNLYYDRSYGWGDFRAMVSHVRANVWPGDVVLLSSGTAYPVFNYYFGAAQGWRGQLQQFPGGWDWSRGPAVVQVGSVDDARRRLSTPEDAPETPREAEANLAVATASARRVWYLRVIESVTDRNAVVHGWLDRNLFETDRRWLAGTDYLQLYRYSTWRPSIAQPPAGAKPAGISFANGAAIAAFELAPDDPRPGDAAALTVYWQARRPIEGDYQIFAHLVDHENELVAQLDGPPLNGRHPTSRWQPGETIRDEYLLPLRRELPVGVYHIRVGMYDLASQRRAAVAEAAGDAATLGEIVVHPSAVASGLDRPALATFGSVIQLRDIRVDPASWRLSGQIDLTLVWQAAGKPPADYKVFVHLLGGEGRIIAQQDSEPLRGAFPTTKWRAGDVVDDQYLLPLPPNGSGPYRFAVGLYEPASSRRLDLPGSPDGRLILDIPSG